MGNQMNFIDYLGVEEQNLLASLVNFREEFDLFHQLDDVYQAPLNRFQGKEGEEIVPTLFLFVHFHLYFTASCLLRSHLSEALSSLRKAIDAGLTAYVLVLEPAKSEAYINRDKFFRFIKRNIQDAINKDKNSYPLARDLIKIHDMCSELGSHADISSFLHRFETKERDDSKQYELFVHYFQFPKDNPKIYSFYLLSVLYAFYMLFLIFKVFFDQNLRIIDPTWERNILKLGPQLAKKRNVLDQEISAQNQ
ncbi:MAG: hypothetical protein K9K66_15660 [Desulfarculaceae bacterium]|nr:hypothetical protein [Desulfarculaceae bacterium]MCF8073569.1 hypothetical protein [Desulfarculaceae bacterium]MCF8103091.1 hypothetical protein [Desulfarculaceae bacterium]MCF8115715.1 hypothetical protein [Desulfarculaceae bacterium]